MECLIYLQNHLFLVSLILKRYSQPPMRDLLATARSQCVSHASLVLQGAFTQQRY